MVYVRTDLTEKESEREMIVSWARMRFYVYVSRETRRTVLCRVSYEKHLRTNNDEVLFCFDCFEKYPIR